MLKDPHDLNASSILTTHLSHRSLATLQLRIVPWLGSQTRSVATTLDGVQLLDGRACSRSLCVVERGTVLTVWHWARTLPRFSTLTAKLAKPQRYGPFHRLEDQIRWRTMPVSITIHSSSSARSVRFTQSHDTSLGDLDRLTRGNLWNMPDNEVGFESIV